MIDSFTNNGLGNGLSDIGAMVLGMYFGRYAIGSFQS